MAPPDCTVMRKTSSLIYTALSVGFMLRVASAYMGAVRQRRIPRGSWASGRRRWPIESLLRSRHSEPDGEGSKDSFPTAETSAGSSSVNDEFDSHETGVNSIVPVATDESGSNPTTVPPSTANEGSGKTTTTATTTTSSGSSSSRKNKRPIVYPPPPTASEFPAWAYEPRDFFRFEILHESTVSKARVGRIHTPHGTIDTPSFVAVATNAALKGVDFREADASNQQLIFSNTYHLLLHPGPDIIAEAGGIHKWTGRTDRPFITDSGGFQVFSLAYGSVYEESASKGELKRGELNRASKSSKRIHSHRSQLNGQEAVKITEDGAVFRSYRDGSKLLLTPESTVVAQKQIGADIIIPLDELPGYYTAREKLVESVERTHRWEARSLNEHLKDVKGQAMYCVVHGGVDQELRKQSVDYLTSLPFDGYAIGGSLGNGRDELNDLLKWLMPMFNKDDRIQSKPRHLLGIADEESIRNAVPSGIDTLDSCYPTRLGRHGTVLTRQGVIRLQSGTHSRSFGVKIDDQCGCSTCAKYDRAYLWHLFKANEPIAVNLAAIHNIHYMNDLMAQLRQDILDNKI